MNTLKLQDKAPEFNGIDQDGNSINFDTIKTKYLVMYFYPKDMTPGCTTQACGIRDNLGEVQNYDATVIGISKDTQKSHKNFANVFKLNYPLIADVEKKICNDYGVLKERSMFGRNVNSIRRSTFIIEVSTRKILHIIEDANPITHAKDVINFLKQA